MNLLIKIENDKPVNNPIAEENLRYFIPDLDVNNPPEGYARFIRKPYPDLSPIETLESTEYVIDDELTQQYGTTVWTDKYNVREMTVEEIAEMLQEEIRASNEKMKETMNAPYSAPDDGYLYIWSKSSNAWVLMPENFNEIVTEYTQKLNELGLSNLSPDQLESLDDDKKQQLQQIVNKINNIEQII